MTPEQLDLLAMGEYDIQTVTELCAAERSRRRLAVRVVVRHARAHVSATGSLAPVDDAWNLLLHAEGMAPRVVAELLNRPQVGVWAAHTLRRLRGKADDDEAPLWFHVGQLHSMACGAATLAGLPFEMDIPLLEGVGVLPGVGHVHLPSAARFGIGRVVRDAGGRVEAVDTRPGDEPVRTVVRPQHILRGGDHDTTPRVHLDDVGPYRSLNLPVRPAPLPDPDVTRWQGLFEEAARLLHGDYGSWARELSAGLSVIAPEPARFRFRPYSASIGDGFGAAIMSEPYDPPQCAVTLVHEFQHSKLNAVHHLVPLALDEKVPECYSPWRDDPRPTMGLFQGVFAFTAVGEFWRRRREHVSGTEQTLADFEFALLRAQIGVALGDLENRPSLTPTGQRFVARIRDRTASWSSVEVPDEMNDAARVVALDHQLCWRVSHGRLDGDTVRAAVAAWSGRHCDLESRIPEDTSPKLDVKAVLRRVLITDPDLFARTRSTGEGPIADDAAEGDFALIAGHPAEARELYVTELSNGSDRPGAWSGLVIAMHATSPEAAAESGFARRLELVVAVHREVLKATGKSPNPEELAAWLDSYV